MRPWKFSLLALAVGVVVFALALLLGSGYLFFAGYVVLQFIVLATAWNILGGYCGYVNFGSAAFFAIGTYTTVALQKVGANSGRFLSGTFAEFLQPLFPLSIPTAVIVSGTIAGVIGLGMGYLTLRLKLIATTVSGAFMGMAGAPYPYYIGYVEPSGTFGLQYAVNSIAMPMIGGTTTWAGPLIGAILLGSLQQIATVTISSAVNLLLVGVLLVVFVIIAPKGIIGLVLDWRRAREKP